MPSLWGKIALTIIGKPSNITNDAARYVWRGTYVTMITIGDGPACDFILIELVGLFQDRAIMAALTRTRGRNFSRAVDFSSCVRHDRYAHLLPADQHLCNRHDRLRRRSSAGVRRTISSELARGNLCQSFATSCAPINDLIRSRDPVVSRRVRILAKQLYNILCNYNDA